MASPAPPDLITDIDAAYLDANAQFGGCPTRPHIAKSHYSVELLAYDLVREAFEDPRMTPRSVEYFRFLPKSGNMLAAPYSFRSALLLIDQ
jgi:hypothetical protein